MKKRMFVSLLVVILLLTNIVLAEETIERNIDRSVSQSSSSIPVWTYGIMGGSAILLIVAIILLLKFKKMPLPSTMPEKEEIKPFQELEKTKINEIKEEATIKAKPVVKDEVKKVLRITDDLLGKLPPEEAKKFVNSPDFKLYQRVMNDIYDPTAKDHEKIKKTAELLKKKVIDEDEAREHLGLKPKIIKPQKIKKASKEEILTKLKKGKKYEPKPSDRDHLRKRRSGKNKLHK